MSVPSYPPRTSFLRSLPCIFQATSVTSPPHQLLMQLELDPWQAAMQSHREAQAMPSQCA
jgi:hypothetical protein